MSKTIYFPNDHTADEWQAMANGSAQRAADSFESCDTDGFLSQWASSTMASLYRVCADLAKDGGFAEMAWPLDADNQPVDAWRWTEGRYGSSVMISTDTGNKFWNPSEAKKGATRLARDLAKGWHWGLVRTEAVVTMTGNRTSVYPIVLPKMGAQREVLQVVQEDYTD